MYEVTATNADGTLTRYEIPVAKPITFKVKNAKMSSVVNPTMPTLAAGSTGRVKVTATYKSGKVTVDSYVRSENMTKTGTAKIVQTNGKDKVKIEVEVLKNIEDGTNYGVIKATPLNLKPGKTASVKLQVYQYGQASNVKPATVTLKVKAPK